MDNVDTYLKNATWQIKENANTSFSFPGLQFFVAEQQIKEYLLSNIYKGPIAKAHNDGLIYIHDLGTGLVCYCMGHDLKDLLEQGFNGIHGTVASAPPKHLRTAINQMVNYLFANQMNNSGAQAFNNVDTLLAPYIKYENLTYKEVKQSIQEFIYSMNVPTRVGMQSPFSNVTFDINCPEHLKSSKPKIAGNVMNFTYADCEKEMGMIVKAFFECMDEGDADGRPFTFPIPTINLHKNFIWDNDIAKTIFSSTAKFGTANFQNFINSDLSPEDSYSMCCRLRLDKRQLIKNSGGVFGSGNKTGSIGVVTINLPRIAYEASHSDVDKLEKFYTLLDKYMALSSESLELKRRMINDNLKNGLMPYTKRYIGTFDNHFSTIATIGANEMCLNLGMKDLSNIESRQFVEEVLIYMKTKIQEYQEETGNLYNLEQAPAEGASYKLAKADREKYPDIKTAGTNEPYYTNSTHMPVNHKLNLFEMLESQDKFNKHYNGGTSAHVFLGEKVSDWINAMLLVKTIAEKTSLPFFTITPTFSICPVHGYISGEHQYCPLDHSEEDLKKFGTNI